ncbi:hypothetical protein [Spongiactinospora sp. 9N601]
MVLSVVRETIRALIDTWPQVKAEGTLPAFVAAHVEHRLRSLPLIAQAAG